MNFNRNKGRAEKGKRFWQYKWWNASPDITVKKGRDWWALGCL